MSPAARGMARLGPRGLAAAWAVAAFAALAVLARAPGISRDEAAVVVSAEGGAASLVRGQTPPLGPALAGAAHAAGSRLGLSHLRAFRLGSAVAGALLAGLLALAAWAMAGPAAGLLAPALFWLEPRTLQAGLVATPDLALAALSLAAVVAWRRACAAERPAWAAGFAGALLGGAMLARSDAWTLALALALHAAATHLLARRAGDGAPGPRGLLARCGIAALACAAVVLGAWPGALRAGLGPWLPPAGGARAPLLVLAAVPLALLWVFAGGLVHALARLAEAVRSRAPAPQASDDALLVLAVLATLGGSALAHAPPGARPFLHALPLLAILGARALLGAAALAWPARRGALTAALLLLVLYPGARSAVLAFPDGATAWSELVGGAPGAASRGLRRQDGGETAAALLREVNARAAPGARIWWPGVAPAAVALYARDGRIRPDLAVAADPAEADLAVVALDGGTRDAEYRAWSALRTARPADGAYVDEVPTALVYARPGAWR